MKGVDLAVKDGILLSDLRGSVRDIADSYVKSGVMSSSYLFSDVNKVTISQKGKDKCEDKNAAFTFQNDDYRRVTLSIYEDRSVYFCFKNNFFVRSTQGKKEIAYWITGFEINREIILSYLKYIIIFTAIFSIVILIILYLLIKRLEKSKRKELTIDIAKKVKHEIVRPIAKMESISDSIIADLGPNSQNRALLSNLYQISYIAKSYKLIVRSMFSYVLNKDNLEFVIKNEPRILFDVITKSVDLSLKSKKMKMNIEINTDDDLKNKFVYIDETFFVIAISNLLTNAYEAVFRNQIDELVIKISAFFHDSSIKIKIRNYGSFIEKDRFDEVFNPGVTGNVSTNSGYGLAILKDVVALYNGKITVESEKDDLNLQNSWTEISIELKNIKHTLIEHSEGYFEKEIEIRKFLPNSKLKILISDDEFFSIDHFKNMFKSINSDLLEVDYVFQHNQSIERKEYDLAIIDLKFFQDESHGYVLSKMVREYSPHAWIVIHTSSFFEDIQEKYSKYDLNEFVQKTMSFDKLIEILEFVQRKKTPSIDSNLFEIREGDQINIVVIDDEPYLYESWKSLNPECHFSIYSHFDDLFDHIDLGKVDIKRTNLIITDFYFDKIRSGMTLFTNDYLGTLKEIYDYTGPVVLATNGSSVDSPLLDLSVEKKPTKIKRLIDKIKKNNIKSNKIF